jgi:hypothetical protein
VKSEDVVRVWVFGDNLLELNSGRDEGIGLVSREGVGEGNWPGYMIRSQKYLFCRMIVNSELVEDCNMALIKNLRSICTYTTARDRSAS